MLEFFLIRVSRRNGVATPEMIPETMPATMLKIHSIKDKNNSFERKMQIVGMLCIVFGELPGNENKRNSNSNPDNIFKFQIK